MTRDGWRPRLLALDIDGTLLEPGGQIDRATVAAVQGARSAGAHIVLVTGRATFELAPVVRALALHEGYAICSNGAVSSELATSRTLSSHTFEAKAGVEAILREVPHALVAVEENGVGYAVTRPFPPGELIGRQRTESLATMLAAPVTRAIVRDPGGSVHDFVRLLPSLALPGITCTVGYKAWFDLGPSGVTKGSSLAELAGILGVAAGDVLAIGDGRNDLEMLQWAGRGVAMGQAPPEVRLAADHVTGDVAELGAAQEILRWFPAEHDRVRQTATPH